MKNNLTKKEIDNLLKWAKEYEIEDLDSEEEILNIKELRITTRIKSIPEEVFKLTNIEMFYIRRHN